MAMMSERKFFQFFCHAAFRTSAVQDRREGILLTNSRLAVELTEHALRQSFPSRAVCPCWLLFTFIIVKFNS